MSEDGFNKRQNLTIKMPCVTGLPSVNAAVQVTPFQFFFFFFLPKWYRIRPVELNRV